MRSLLSDTRHQQTSGQGAVIGDKLAVGGCWSRPHRPSEGSERRTRVGTPWVDPAKAVAFFYGQSVSLKGRRQRVPESSFSQEMVPGLIVHGAKAPPFDLKVSS